MRERILIMTCEPSQVELYELALKPKGFVTRTVSRRGRMGPSGDWWTPQEGMIENILDFGPRIIICDLSIPLSRKYSPSVAPE